MNTETLRTDELEEDIHMNRYGKPMIAALHLCRELERENAELRAQLETAAGMALRCETRAVEAECAADRAVESAQPTHFACIPLHAACYEAQQCLGRPAQPADVPDGGTR